MDLDIQCEEFNESKWKELVPSLNQYKTIRLNDCCLLNSHCEDLASVLSSNQTLTELKLNNNELRDSGLEKLCKGLMSPSCKLQKLWLQNCNLTKACCENLRSVLSTKPSLLSIALVLYQEQRTAQLLAMPRREQRYQRHGSDPPYTYRPFHSNDENRFQ